MNHDGVWEQRHDVLACSRPVTRGGGLISVQLFNYNYNYEYYYSKYKYKYYYYYHDCPKIGILF
jgi:hypothetical protein